MASVLESESAIESLQSPPRKRSVRRWPRTLVFLLIAAAFVCAVGYGANRMLTSDDVAGPTMSTFRVEPGELLVTVVEDGNVESANNVDVKCQVAGGSAILSIVEDGTEVAAGDKIVELDSAALEDQINTQKISYSKARSAVIQAQKNFQVAEISVKEYLEGTFVKELEDAETQITIAEENLRSAKNSLEYSDRMFQRGYISELELESQQFAVKRAQLELNAANTVKKVLVEFTKEKTLEDLRSQVETAKATMESEQAAFDLEESKLKRLETQIENCTIVAPQAGMVVYANERGRFGQSSSSIEEGAAVRDRQTMLRIPDLSQMQVKVNVHETKVEDLRTGMRARINIQGRELQGYVTSVANQPESTSFFQGNVKEYATIVKIDGNPDGLKPGMTAEVEILVAHLKDVFSLPVSAVVEQRGQFSCWVKGPDGSPQRRPLILGVSNDQFVEVKDGVAESDEVLRNPRALVADARQEAIEVEDVNVTDRFGDARPETATDERESRSPQAARGDGGDPGDRTPEGGRPGGREEGARRGGGGGRGRMNLMQYDTDGDGKVSKDEAPDRMSSFFDRLDGNGDGFIDQSEVDALRSRFGGGGGRGSESSGGRPSDPG